MKAPITAAARGFRPPRLPPAPIKGHLHPRAIPHPSPPLSPSPSHRSMLPSSPTTATTSPSLPRRSVAPRASVSPVVSSSYRRFPSRPPPVSTGKPEPHPGRSPVTSHLRRRAGPPWTGPRPWSTKRGPGPRISHCKINQKNRNSVILGIFAEKPLSFFIINPRSTNFSVRSEIQKIFTKRSLASEKSTKIAPKFQKFISFQPQLQIQ
jgi:hypothetical protein